MPPHCRRLGTQRAHKRALPGDSADCRVRRTGIHRQRPTPTVGMASPTSKNPRVAGSSPTLKVNVWSIQPRPVSHCAICQTARARGSVEPQFLSKTVPKSCLQQPHSPSQKKRFDHVSLAAFVLLETFKFAFIFGASGFAAGGDVPRFCLPSQLKCSTGRLQSAPPRPILFGCSRWRGR
jgi:hypothetical protein